MLIISRSSARVGHGLRRYVSCIVSITVNLAAIVVLVISAEVSTPSDSN